MITMFLIIKFIVVDLTKFMIKLLILPFKFIYHLLFWWVD